MVESAAQGPEGSSPEKAPDEGETPKGIDRRGFVKGMMAGAAVGAIGAGAALTAGGMIGTYQRPEDTRVVYSGAKVLIGSPAPRGLPFVPLTVASDGTIRGRPDDLRPFRTCRRDTDWDGLQDDFRGDDDLRYAIGDHKLAITKDDEERRERWWYLDLRGERLNVDHFADLPEGTGAQFTWRDHDTHFPAFEGTIVKLPFASIQAEGAARSRLEAAMLVDHDLVAFDAACTHFCCHATWKENPSAAQLGYWDTIFCTCHAARFDPRQIDSYSFDLKTGPDVL